MVSTNFGMVRFEDFAMTNWISYGSEGTGRDNFDLASGFCIRPDGGFIITDTRNDRIVAVDDLSGTNWEAYGETGSGVGQFDNPTDIELRFE